MYANLRIWIEVDINSRASVVITIYDIFCLNPVSFVLIMRNVLVSFFNVISHNTMKFEMHE